MTLHTRDEPIVVECKGQGAFHVVDWPVGTRSRHLDSKHYTGGGEWSNKRQRILAITNGGLGLGRRSIDFKVGEEIWMKIECLRGGRTLKPRTVFCR